MFGKFSKLAVTESWETKLCRNSGIGSSQSREASEYDYFRAFRFVLLVSAVGMFLLAGLAVGGVAAQQTISDAQDLRGVSTNGDYVLKDDIDMSGVSGFKPIGDRNDRTADRGGTPFTGTFDGNGHTVLNLTIDRPDENYVGLFGAVGSEGKVENVGIENATVTGDGWTGGLVGFNGGEVNRSYAGGDVSVSGNWTTGGLVGVNLNGDVRASYATGSVSGDEKIGGLVGINFEGSIEAVFS